jgi:hypothetical protein
VQPNLHLKMATSKAKHARPLKTSNPVYRFLFSFHVVQLNGSLRWHSKCYSDAVPRGGVTTSTVPLRPMRSGRVRDNELGGVTFRAWAFLIIFGEMSLDLGCGGCAYMRAELDFGLVGEPSVYGLYKGLSHSGLWL